MKKIIQLCVLLTLLFQLPLSRANAIACVDPDIAQTLIGQAYERPLTITRELPDDFPPMAIPENFKLIGSKDSDRTSVVAYKTDLTSDEAKDGLESALVEDGWRVPEMPNHRGMSRGFQNSQVNAVLNSSNFCHSDHGLLSAMYSGGPEDITYVTFSSTRTLTRGSFCDAMASRNLNFVSRGMDSMPILDLPDGTKSMSMGGGSNGDGASTRTQLESSMSAAELVTFFGRQLVNQDWQEDAQWGGQRASGSTWISEDGETMGFLRIISQGKGRYRLTFETVVGQRANTGFIMMQAN